MYLKGLQINWFAFFVVVLLSCEVHWIPRWHYSDCAKLISADEICINCKKVNANQYQFHSFFVKFPTLLMNLAPSMLHFTHSPMIISHLYPIYSLLDWPFHAFWISIMCHFSHLWLNFATVLLNFTSISRHFTDLISSYLAENWFFMCHFFYSYNLAYYSVQFEVFLNIEYFF